MKKSNNGIVFSPSDLSNHISCKHLTNLNKKAALGEIKKPTYTNRVVDLLRERGLQFENEFLETLAQEGKSILKLSQENDNAEIETISAMKMGIDVIYQARLVKYGEWEGWADFLIKVDTPSEFGNWSYEVLDTKLATETRAGTILQIALYSERVGEIQGGMPINMRVQNPDGEFSYRVDDYIAYVRLAKKQLLGSIQNSRESYPEPIEHCNICKWWEVCNQKRRDDDHLGFIAGMGAAQIKEVRNQNVNTLEEMAKVSLPIPFKPNRGAVETYTKLREQARVQHQGRITRQPIHEMLDLVPEKGLNKLPDPTKKDIYLDLEGDPMVEPGGLEYLFGWYCEGIYQPIWVQNEREEKDAFEYFFQFAQSIISQCPGAHIYHYAPYETTAFKRIMSKYATCENEMDSFLRAGTFVDLYGVVRQSIRASVEKYSIKDLEKFYGYNREMDLRELSKHKVGYEYLLETNKLGDATIEMKDAIQLYNQDDCISTKHLHEWLEGLRNQLILEGKALTRPSLVEGTPAENITAHLERIRPIFDGLIFGISPNKSERTNSDQAKFILAHMLDWYRREKKSVWWEYFRLLNAPPDELLDEKSGLAYLTPTGVVENVAKSVIVSYSFPHQECEFKKKGALKDQDGQSAGTIEDIDTQNRIIKIKRGNTRAEQHPSSIFLFEDFKTTDKENAIIEMAQWIVTNGIDSTLPDYRAGRDLLLRLLPRTTGTVVESDQTLKYAFDWSMKLDNSILSIQGPPGTGKSYTASNMIIQLIREKKKIGVTALSHKVITGLLEKINSEASKISMNVRMIQKVSADNQESYPWQTTTKGDDIIANLAQADVIAGTSFMWCLPAYRESVDYLFVDEAGQLALIDTLAISQAAKNIVLLGDPQQLQQPQQGVHPDGCEVSALEHIIQEHQTISPEQGVFLKETWRMHPMICAFDSEMFYESKLNPRPSLENQTVLGNCRFTGSGLRFVPVFHQGNTSSSIEEINIIIAIIDELTKGDVYWKDVNNNERLVTKSDIKIIAPYNAQVQSLSEHVKGVSIGTVDKFQGQEAPIIIYSVATSSPADAPRGMEFLYSPNRFNVAVSRAKGLFIMIANPTIFEPDCKNPTQIKLANPFCRFRELAEEINLTS
jgi:predicted RecB family nuclease